jgi:hypothetical protein
MRCIALLAAGFVLSCTGIAGARPCTASGVFGAGNFSSFWFWDLHDRAGEISGVLRYYAWNVYVDVGPPSVRQFAAVSGSRKGGDIVLAVADPLGSGIVRKVHASLHCFPPTPHDSSDGALDFPLRPREYRDRQLFVRWTGHSLIPMILKGMAKSTRAMYSLSQGPVRDRARHDPALRARIAAKQAELRRGAFLQLDEMAAVTPQ